LITEQQSKSRAPHIQALISAALLSTLYISLKSTSIVNAFAYWSIVFLVAAASLSCYISARGIPKYSLCKQDLKVILVSAFSAEVGAPLLIYTGLLYTTPAHGSITSSIEIVLTVLFSAIIVKERLPVRRYLGLALVVAGVAIVTVGGAQFNIGDLMIIGSAALYAFDNSYTVRLSEAIPTERVLQLKFFI
jgi:drug/metabolite transporter (DMT)-like permease